MPTTSRARGRAPLGLLAAAAVLLALPGAASAAADFSVSMPQPDLSLGELVLRARCDPACTVKLSELNVTRFKTRGGVAQLPHPASGPLSATRKVPAGRTVSIRVAVPAAVQRTALASLPAGEALVGNVAMTVDQGAGAAPAVRQFAVTGPGTPSPYPASQSFDVIRLRASQKPARGSRQRRWELTVAGVQRSEWSYDRSETIGGCAMIARGSGRQTLTVRTPRPVTVVESVWPSGRRILRTAGSPWPLASADATIDVDRDSGEEKRMSGNCSEVPSGGDGGDGPSACERTGSRNVSLGISSQGGRGVSAHVAPQSFDSPTLRPDCPVELAKKLVDPLDLLPTPTSRGGGLSTAGKARKVIVVLKGSDVTRLDGGSVRTTLQLTLTFRRVN